MPIHPPLLGGLLALSLPIAASHAQRATVPSQLPYGRHAVGYRELALSDVSRPAFTGLDGGDTAVRAGRRVRVSLWYPARAGGSALAWGDYVADVLRAFDARPIDAVRRRAAADSFVARAAAHGGDTAALRRALPELLRTPARARRDAPAAAGRFPLVLFPEWRPPAANAMLAEYLASHGFVVASHPLAGSTDPDVEYFAVRGIDALTADAAFVLASLQAFRGIDVHNVATLGVGIAGTAALALQMRTPAVRAVVSLEGGITTAGEQRLLLRTAAFDVGRVHVPMLAITAPHPSVDAARLDLYRYADRRIVHFPAMGEFWFLDFGLLEARIPGILGRAPGNTALGYTWAARLVERFLAAELRGDTVARAFLDAPPGAPDGLFTMSRRRALPAPPDVPALKRLLAGGGLRALDSLVAARAAAGDSQPIASEHFVNLDAWLSEGRDASGESRRALAALRARLHPGSARAHAALASASLRLRDSTSAREHLGVAVRLLGEDDDPQLDPWTRRGIVRTANALGVPRG